MADCNIDQVVKEGFSVNFKPGRSQRRYSLPLHLHLQSNCGCSCEECSTSGADCIEICLPKNSDTMRYKSLLYIWMTPQVPTGKTRHTVLPTCSWNAALAARRIWISRSNTATMTNLCARCSAWGLRNWESCDLAKAHRTYAAPSRTLEPIECAPFRISKYNA